MSDRKNDILKAALELYNKKGFENVTIRDIAKKINISSGNLTYHFPTQNDILYALMELLLVEINIALSLPVSPAYKSALLLNYHQCRIIIKKQLEFKFIFNKRYAEIVTSLPKMQKLLQEVLVARFDQWKYGNDLIVKEGSALPTLKKDTHAVSHLVNIVALYWHQEVTIYYPHMTDADKLEHATALVFQIYKPYLTKKGLSELMPLMKKLDHY